MNTKIRLGLTAALVAAITGTALAVRNIDRKAEEERFQSEMAEVARKAEMTRAAIDLVKVEQDIAKLKAERAAFRLLAEENRSRALDNLQLARHDATITRRLEADAKADRARREAAEQNFQGQLDQLEKLRDVILTRHRDGESDAR